MIYLQSIIVKDTLIKTVDFPFFIQEPKIKLWFDTVKRNNHQNNLCTHLSVLVVS